MAGIKHGAQRPKISKGLRTTNGKHFRNDSEEARSRYKLKLAARAKRRTAKRNRKG
jgi:hypothetical protein